VSARQKEKERAEALEKEFLALQLMTRAGTAFRSVPSTTAISGTLVASSSQSLQQYNVPQDAIIRIAQDQAKQVVEKNIIPLIEETAKTTIQEHEKRERENARTLLLKRQRGMATRYYGYSWVSP
jgi:hypothetical protein